jgi:hypothetical protein
VDEIAQDFRSTPDVWLALFTVNISDILFGVSGRGRSRLASISVDPSFSPNDPRFNEILTRVRRERDARIARFRRNKKKFAAAKARGRRQDIVVAPRVKDINYQFAMQDGA